MANIGGVGCLLIHLTPKEYLPETKNKNGLSTILCQDYSSLNPSDSEHRWKIGRFWTMSNLYKLRPEFLKLFAKLNNLFTKFRDFTIRRG